MKKEAFDLAKREMGYIGLLFLIALIVFKIAFFKESFVVLLRNVFAIFWLFALPGYFIMLYWSSKLEFIERLVIGIAVSAGLTGIASYYLGLVGLNIKYHMVILPAALILAGIAANWKKQLSSSEA